MKKGTRFASSPLNLVRLAGIEPTTPWFVAKYSIQLSYSREEQEYNRVHDKYEALGANEFVIYRPTFTFYGDYSANLSKNSISQNTIKNEKRD
jgi:hypothetical protein